MNKIPRTIKGNCHSDDRGNLYYNNDFDSTAIKRIYFIENKTVEFVRAWQGHQIEQRWFSAVQGSFKIIVIAISDWKNLSGTLSTREFILESNTFDILYVPNGYITSIQALNDNSKLMAMSDYGIGEINDEYRLDINYFK
jgi:dTDP-4-dehydrorhamnose 3,5-epimerase-like enzyme